PAFARHAGALLFTDAALLHSGLEAFNALAETRLDALMLVLPLLLLGSEAIRPRASVGRLAYLGSVTAPYTTLLLAVHHPHVMLTLAVALSVALFHATEYLAIVSWAVLRRPAQDRSGAFAYLRPRWALSLALFIGVLAISAWALDSHFQRQWAALTIAVSF